MRISDKQQMVNIDKLLDIKKIENVKANSIKEEKDAADTYEGSVENSYGTYDKNEIFRLKKESERIHQDLIRIVEDMLKRQGKTLNLLSDGEMIDIDEATRTEANKLIGPDGDLGVEAVSNRLVDFAIALSGGDKSKASILRGAIDKGFKEAEKMLGKLPDISKETYKATMEKFDKYFNE